MAESERDLRSEDIKQFEVEKARRVANVERNSSLTTEERGDLIRMLSDLTHAEAARIRDRAIDLSIKGVKLEGPKNGGLTAAEEAERVRIHRIQFIWELTGEPSPNATDQDELRRLLREEKRDQTPIRDPAGYTQRSGIPSAGLISGGQDVKTTVAQSLPGLPLSLGKC